MLPLAAAAVVVPGVTGGGEAKQRILELGFGDGKNLLRIEAARSGWSVVGVELDQDALRLGKLNAKKSRSNVSIIRADYLEAPFQSGQFDEVVAIAPGSRKYNVVNAAEAAAEMVSAKGRIYIVTDLGKTPEAIEALTEGLKRRGIELGEDQITSGFR